MLSKIQDHFILIDKCAGQTRIAEIEDRILTKYICWPDSSPPIIGNIYKADIIKKLNGGVVRAKTKDHLVLTVRGVPKDIKANSKIDVIITSEQYDDKPVQAKIFLQDMSDCLELSNIQRIIYLYFQKNLPIVEDYHAIYWNILDLDKVFLNAFDSRVEIKDGGVLWIEKTKTATLIDIDLLLIVILISGSINVILI